MAALKIPKAFLEYEEGIAGKATRAAEDVRFARTIERIQKIFVSELSKLGIIHLYTQGFKEADIVNVYYLLADQTIEEDIAELLDEKRKVIASILDGKDVEDESILTKLMSKILSKQQTH